MITKFDKYSGIFSVNINNQNMVFNLQFNEEKEPFEVGLYIRSKLYQMLSIIIPDSENLSEKEFFINPKVDENIIEVLESENFISETGKESVAGDKEVKSYKLII